MSQYDLTVRLESDVARFTDLGFANFRDLLTVADLEHMDAVFPVLPERTPGARSESFTLEARSWLTSHSILADLAGHLLRVSSAHLSRIQAFNEFPGSNWFVPWHQDRAEDGVDRSIETLERTVALRVHLDDCNEHSGPLHVLPGSHLHGRLDAQDIAQELANATSLQCLAKRGEILAMRPLLVHSSQRARAPIARRVIHLVYQA